jgi:predicted transcriptional regulator
MPEYHMTTRTLKHDTEHESVKISFLTAKANRDALDTIATAMDRDRSYILNEAITAYLEVHQWHLQDTRKAIEEADAGDFASDREVQQAFAKYKHNAR